MVLRNHPSRSPLLRLIDHSRFLRINIKHTAFYTIFILVFCLSGLLTMVSPIPYRMGLVSALVIPLIFLYGIKFDQILLVYAILVVEIIVSAIYNGSSLFQLITFLRIPAFSYFMYYLAKLYINETNIEKIIKWCVNISLIQLPIILIQWSSYSKLPAKWTATASIVDFGFGTFNFKTDYAMAFFLTLLVTFLLFDQKRNYIIRYKWPVVLWLTLTIMVANAQVVKVVILLVWSVYLIVYFNPKMILAMMIVLLLFMGIIQVLSNFGILTETATTFVSRLSNIQSSASSEGYLSGNYSRVGALGFFLSENILWLGDGPSTYSNVFAQTLLRGNTGHIYTFYSEVGLLGWVLSEVALFSIAFPICQARVRITWMQIFMFVSISILAFTSQVMNDIAVMLIYCIMAKSYLIPTQKPDSHNLLELS